MLKLTVEFDFGSTKNCVTNLGQFFEPDVFLDKTFPFVMNLEPTSFSLSKGAVEVSEVMIMVSKTSTFELGNGISLDGKQGSQLL